MALIVKDRVKETSTTTGTGSYTLAGAASGFQSFADALADGDTTWYGIEDGTNWEVGLGTWDESAGTLARTTVYSSSNSGSAVNWGAGSKNVFMTLPASRKSTLTVYPTIDDLPLTGDVLEGDQAYVSGNNRLYLYNGSGWYNIALVNTTPTVSGNNANYTLATDGTATVVTMAGTDAEGIPLTWSATTSGDTSAAIVTSLANVFTITPSTDTANAGTLTVAFKASDGVNVGSSSSDFLLAFVSAYWPNVEFLAEANSTDGTDDSIYIDRSSNAHSVTVTGGTPSQQAFHPYLDNWSVEFDGNGDYLTAASDSSLQLGSESNWTIEMWVQLVSTPSDFDVILGKGASGTFEYFIEGFSDRTIDFLYSSNGSPWTGQHQITPVIDLGEWYHLAVVRDGASLKSYVNGVEYFSGSAGNIYIGSGLLGVGGYSSGAQDPNVILSNVRIVKGTSVYTSAFTPSTTPLTDVSGTSLLTCNANRFIDTSSNDHTITVNGNPKVSAYNPFGQESEYSVADNKGSVFFDNAGGLDVASSTDLGTGDFTIQGWLYLNAASGTQMIISNRGDSGSIFLGTTGTELYPYIGGSYATSGAGLRAYEWTHFALCRTSGSIETYVNGVKYRTDSKSNDLFGSSGYKIGNGDVGQMNGYIADLQVASTAKYTGASHTIPTAPVGNTDADLYLPMDNAGIFDKTGVNTIELVNNAESDTAITKFASSSLKFASANDYIIVERAINTSSDDLTIEGWFYFDFTNSNVYFAGHNTTYAANNNMFQLGLASGKPSWWIGGSAAFSASALSVDTWYHLAFVKEGNDYEIFVDGTSVRTFTNSNSINSYGWRLGNSYDGASQGFTGNIENFQILSGVAKYTANFTPPTSTQGRTNQVVS